MAEILQALKITCQKISSAEKNGEKFCKNVKGRG